MCRLSGGCRPGKHAPQAELQRRQPRRLPRGLTPGGHSRPDEATSSACVLPGCPLRCGPGGRRGHLLPAMRGRGEPTWWRLPQTGQASGRSMGGGTLEPCVGLGYCPGRRQEPAPQDPLQLSLRVHMDTESAHTSGHLVPPVSTHFLLGHTPPPGALALSPGACWFPGDFRNSWLSRATSPAKRPAMTVASWP